MNSLTTFLLRSGIVLFAFAIIPAFMLIAVDQYVMKGAGR